jgi:hypothetical protein
MVLSTVAVVLAVGLLAAAALAAGRLVQVLVQDRRQDLGRVPVLVPALDLEAEEGTRLRPLIPGKSTPGICDYSSDAGAYLMVT